MAATKCHYATLGIPQTAPHKEIRTAFRQLAKTWHPDKNKSMHKQIAEEKFKEISSAFSVLGDAVARRDYDNAQQRASVSRRASTSARRYEYYQEDASSSPPPPPPPRSHTNAPEPWWKKQRREFQRRRRDRDARRETRSSTAGPRKSVRIGNVTVSCGAANGCRVVRHSDGGVSISFEPSSKHGHTVKKSRATGAVGGISDATGAVSVMRAEPSTPCEELRHACHWGKATLLKRLLAHNLGLIRSVVDPKNGGTCLHIAAARGRLECVRLLCCLGADLGARDNEKKTPLHRGSENGHTGVVEFLLKIGADANAMDRSEQTPLTLACAWRYAETAKVLRASMNEMK